MYFNNPNLITQEEYDKLEKEDTITNVSCGEKEMMEWAQNKVVGDLEGINRPPKTKEINTLDLGQIKIPKPTAINQSETVPLEPAEKYEERLKEIKDLAKHGIKETKGKVDYSEIDWNFIESMALRMNKNKGKYEPENYKKPMDVRLLKQSLLRHVLEVLKGNYEDDGDELGHLAAIALNAQMINYQLKNNL